MSSVRPALRLLRTASFRLAALYVAVFAASALVLGVAVYYAARSELEQQTDARIATELSYLREEFRHGGLDHLLGIVEVRGHGASALDYLVQDRAGTHLTGEIPGVPGLQPGRITVRVPEASEDGGRPEVVRAEVADLSSFW